MWADSGVQPRFKIRVSILPPFLHFFLCPFLWPSLPYPPSSLVPSVTLSFHLSSHFHHSLFLSLSWGSPLASWGFWECYEFSSGPPNGFGAFSGENNMLLVSGDETALFKRLTATTNFIYKSQGRQWFFLCDGKTTTSTVAGCTNKLIGCIE